MTLRHRHLLAMPFVLLLLATLAGGLANSTDARMHFVDDLTDKPIEGVQIVHGTRTAASDASGDAQLASVPRTSQIQVRPPSGYQHIRVPTTTQEVRLDSLSVTIYAYDETKTQEDRIPNPQTRDVENTKIIASGNAGGQIIVAPHPGRDARVKVCAEGFEPKDITVEGVLMQIGLQPGGTGCPPLPTPTPGPATPTPTASPEGSPEPTPAPTPTPTGTP